ncbi:MAG: CusA/CzcA family heavy metal efflux RND transporter [Aquificaceae bacterium]|nr:CusA/CzcA family heavy metal efflux RND transporter [Aquificaceae bacterium]MDW8066577.1 CusA/CzcA family heavy metal efflux RND transporter [Aquificaceae bacterium]MDW8423157.1 CusA/CzcA family heavy metal efflux RND transporter [Aquificaceae bacterium]
MIRWILSYRLFVILLLVLVVAYGTYNLFRIPVDTFPDPTPAQVVIYTETPGMSAEETEVLVTKPIESLLAGIKDAELVRSISLPGLSYVAVFFKEGTDLYFARSLVSQKLVEAKNLLPQNVAPHMGPNTSGLGNVMFYALFDNTGKFTLEDLKTLQEWRVKPFVKAVEGVEEVSQWGPEKAYIVRIEPQKLLQHNVSPFEVVKALEENSKVSGGGFLQSSEGDLVVRGLGRYESIQDILNVPVKRGENDYVLVGDIARIEEGELPNRRGAFTYKGQEVQGNIVLKRLGINTMELVENLKKTLLDAQKVLPEGVEIRVLYDQAYLTEKAISTLRKAIIEGIVLITIAIAIYLWNIRVAMLVVLSIPLTLFLTFTLLKNLGISANLMTMGGLAIGLGLFADASVVVIENIYRHLSENKKGIKLTIIAQSVQEIKRPLFFAILTIAVVFLPIFTFESVEGKYYKPLAITIILALLSSFVVALLFMPVLSYWFLKEGKEESSLFAYLRRKYLLLLSFAFSFRPFVLSLAFISFVLSLFLFSRVGREFAPPLEEGAVLVKSFLDSNVSLEESKRIAKLVEGTALKYPEVVHTFSNIGRAEAGEPEDVNYIETFIILKPAKDWRNFKSRQEFEEILRTELEKVPGVEFGFTQPIQMRIDELLSGVKATLAVKVFGEDLDKINQIARQVEEIIASTKGAVDVETEAQTGKLQLRIEPQREIMQRYNLTTQELMDLVSYYLGGKEVAQIQEETLLFPVVVGFEEKTLEVLKNIPVLRHEGGYLKLSDVARVYVAEGYNKIRRERGMRYALVQSNLHARDLGGFVKEVKEKIDKNIKLPEGYFISFGGQFENQQRAMKKLMVAVPLAIALIFLLLYMNYGSVKDALIVMLNVPFATVGGVITLYLSGYNLSVPSAVGFIAVFGIATLNGVVLVSYIRNLLQEGIPKREAILEACSKRLRPILITATATSLGLVPMLLSTDIGSELQKPLATVVIGGIFTSTLLTLIVLPLVYDMVRR